MSTGFSMGPMTGQPQQPLGAQTPQSMYLAQALQGMHAQPQSSAGGVGMNLLAEALMQQQYQKQQQNANMPGGAPQSGGMMNGAPMGSGWASQLGGMLGLGGNQQPQWPGANQMASPDTSG